MGVFADNYFESDALAQILRCVAMLEPDLSKVSFSSCEENSQSLLLLTGLL